MSTVVLAMPGNEAQADRFTVDLGAERGSVMVRRFPDGESHVRVDCEVANRAVAIVCTLDRPDQKLVPLLLLAAAVREAAAQSTGLVAPYLPYMRQDRRFHPGETINARHFAKWLSAAFDWLVTVDTHLHRIADLSQIYPIPNRNVHAAPAVADWLRQHVQRPVLVGPDEESGQWVTDVASRAGAPWVVLRKTRRGDTDVEVSVPEVDRWRDHTPVLVDDIVSTGRTMIETVGHLRRAGLAAPVCIAVHAVFAGNAEAELRAAGAAEVVSCDTIKHPSNRIALGAILAQAAHELISPETSPSDRH